MRRALTIILMLALAGAVRAADWEPMRAQSIALKARGGSTATTWTQPIAASTITSASHGQTAYVNITGGTYSPTFRTVTCNGNLVSTGGLTLGDATHWGTITSYIQGANTWGGGLSIYKRGHTGDATAAVGSGSELGYHSFYGWNGAAYIRGAFALASTTEAWSVGATGTNYGIYVTPNTTTGAVVGLTVAHNKDVYAYADLYVTGVIKTGGSTRIDASGNFTAATETVGGAKNWGKLSAAPGSPTEGDEYYDTTAHKKYVYDGSTWQACW